MPVVSFLSRNRAASPRSDLPGSGFNRYKAPVINASSGRDEAEDGARKAPRWANAILAGVCVIGMIFLLAMIALDVWPAAAGILTIFIDVFIILLLHKVVPSYQPPLLPTVRGVGYSLRDGS